MRSRPIRPNIYLPVVRFGVADSDWFTVLLISCAGYLAPVPFGVTVWGWGTMQPSFNTSYVSYAYPAGQSLAKINDLAWEGAP